MQTGSKEGGLVEGWTGDEEIKNKTHLAQIESE
jgi:hypothetical protein